MALKFAKFFGNTVSEGAAFAAGVAIGPTLMPLLRALESATWEQYPDKPPEAGPMALGVAHGKVTAKQGAKWAKQNGYNQEAFDALVAVAQVGPALGQAMELWRRGYITPEQFETALDRLGIAQTWHASIKQLKLDVLDPADLARAIHKGLIPDPGLLAVPAPHGVGNVPAYPVYPVDGLAMALASGYDKDLLGVLVGLQGNPMGPHEAAQAYFRGVLKEVDFERAIAEGNTRNEWGQAILAQSRQIPTARDFVENALRGYRTLPDAIKGAEMHGMSAADATLIYQNQGRPMNIRQITKALARGAHFNPEPGEIEDPYMASIVEGILKPGYYELEQSLKYVYPGFFQTANALAKGWIDAATAESWMLYQGYEPTAVKLIIAGITGTPAAKKPKTLTAAQVKASFKAGGLERPDALQRLETDGYSAQDAGLYLDS